MEYKSKSTRVFLVPFKMEIFNNKNNNYVQKDLKLKKLFPFVRRHVHADNSTCKYFEFDRNKFKEIGLESNMDNRYYLIARNKSKETFEFEIPKISLFLFDSKYAFLCIEVSLCNPTIESINTFNYFFSETKNNKNFLTLYNDFEISVIDWIHLLLKDEKFDFFNQSTSLGKKPIPEVTVHQLFYDIEKTNYSIQQKSEYFEIHKAEYKYLPNQENYEKTLYTYKPYVNLEYGFSLNGAGLIIKETDNESNNYFFSTQFKSSYFTNYLFLHILSIHLKIILMDNFKEYQEVISNLENIPVEQSLLEIEKLQLNLVKSNIKYRIEVPSFERTVNQFHNGVVNSLELKNLVVKQDEDLKSLQELLETYKSKLSQKHSQNIRKATVLLTALLGINGIFPNLYNYLTDKGQGLTAILSLIGVILSSIIIVITLIVTYKEIKTPKTSNFRTD